MQINYQASPEVELWLKMGEESHNYYENLYNFTRKFYKKLQDLLQETRSFVLKTDNLYDLQFKLGLFCFIFLLNFPRVPP